MTSPVTSPAGEYQPYYAAYLRATGRTAPPERNHSGYINWIAGMWYMFRLESIAKHGSEAERQDFTAWLGRRVP